MSFDEELDKDRLEYLAEYGIAVTDDELTVMVEALREFRYRLDESNPTHTARRRVSEALIMRFAQELLQRTQNALRRDGR